MALATADIEQLLKLTSTTLPLLQQEVEPDNGSVPKGYVPGLPGLELHLQLRYMYI